MAFELIIFWIIAVSAFTLLGAWYVRKYERPDMLIGLYVAFILVSNFTAQKITTYDLGFASFVTGATVLVFSVTFLLTDIVNEKFGRKETQKMIAIGVLTQIAASVFIYLVLSLPPAPFWQNQAVFEQIFGLVPRILIASWIAFFVSENADAYIFAWFKKLTKGRRLWARNAFSSLPSMTLDSFLFVPLGFYGVLPTEVLGTVMIGLLVTKYLVGLVDIPFMYLNRWIMYGKVRL